MCKCIIRNQFASNYQNLNECSDNFVDFRSYYNRVDTEEMHGSNCSADMPSYMDIGTKHLLCILDIYRDIYQIWMQVLPMVDIDEQNADQMILKERIEEKTQRLEFPGREEQAHLEVEVSEREDNNALECHHEIMFRRLGQKQITNFL